ncbi:hypothetical protein C6341_g13733, partial [Phytophthora cactorum]
DIDDLAGPVALPEGQIDFLVSSAARR